MILDKVNTPDDLKNLSVQEMNFLADDMRDLIIKKAPACVTRAFYGIITDKL